MLYITFKKAHDAGACIESYTKLGKALGGITKYGKDTPIGLDKVVAVCGLQDAIWAMRCTAESSENALIEFACRCAEHVLHFYEDLYPDDKRPRAALEAARICLRDKSDAARDAAGDAARDAAWDAAGDAARDAARAAGDAAWAAAADAAGDAARAAGDAARAAGDAAWAAGDAAWAAADAARDAWAAEEHWQVITFLQLLNEEATNVRS